MDVILASMCSGKTSLEKLGTRFVDLDIFANVKTERQIEIARQMIAGFAERRGDGKIYLFNMDRFYKFSLDKAPAIKIICAVVPAADAFPYFETLFIQREKIENGGIRQRAFDTFRRSLAENLGKARELERQGVKVHWLRGGESIKNYLLKNDGLPSVRKTEIQMQFTEK